MNLAHLGVRASQRATTFLAELPDTVRGTVDGVHRGDTLLDPLALGIVEARRNLVGLLVEFLWLHGLSRLSSIRRDS